MDEGVDNERLKELFVEACRVAPPERDAFLEQACGGDGTLRAQVVDLLNRYAETHVAPGPDHPAGTRIASANAIAQAIDAAGAAPGTPRAGDLIDGKYRIEQRIGAGGMGMVYRATHVALERAVALKVLTTSLVLDAGARHRFEREAVAMARLKHPNIVSIYDFGVSEDVGAYFVMEMLDGVSLAREIESCGRLSPDRAAGILSQVCQAVGAAHDAGVIHRDLKPDNVFLERAPHGAEVVKVLDFGIAKLRVPEEGADLTFAGSLIGTPAYMSPEQCRGERLDLRSDIYSLGCLLFQCLTGRTPFVAPSTVRLLVQHLNDTPPVPSTYAPDVSRDMDSVVLAALAKSPADRPATAAVLDAAIRAAAGLPQNPTPHAPTPLATPVGYVTTAQVTSPHNLPQPITSFIARGGDLDALVTSIQTSRLVTLVGPGGIGKTRLALEAGREVLGRFPDGAWLVDLRSLADAASVARAIAATVGVREEADRALIDTLGDALRDRALLVIVDTCEHLVDAVADMAESLLQAAPKLRIVATSREALNVAGETLFHVLPLDVPDVDRRGQGIDAILESGAVQLFVERARRKRQSIELTPDTVRAIGRLCARLDGIPLAIELAASRSNAMSVDQMLARMDDRFALLTVGSRSGRQQTLRAAIDWSYELLSEPERALLQRISVFAGGCTLDAAERVCSGDAVARDIVLDVLTALVDKSLVMVEDRDREFRYCMLDTIREYASDLLNGSSRERDVRERFMAWVLDEAEQTRLGIVAGSEQKEPLDRCDREHDNFRAALRWSVRGRHDVRGGLSLAAKLCHFWDIRSHAQEGLEWLLAAQAAAENDGPSDELAAATFSTGFLYAYTGNTDRSLEQYERSLAIARELGDLKAVATALDGKGDAQIFLSRLDEAEATILEGIELRRKHHIGNEINLVVLGFNLGLVAMERGDYAPARERFEATLVDTRRLGDAWRTTLVLHNLGEICLRIGEPAAAVSRFTESVECGERIGFRKLIAYSRIGAGLATGLLGRPDEAHALVAEGLAASHESGEMRAVTFGLNAMASLASLGGHWRRAILLAGAASAMEGRAGISVAPSERDYYVDLLAPARVQAGDRAEALGLDGAQMRFEDAVALALDPAGGLEAPS